MKFSKKLKSTVIIFLLLVVGIFFIFVTDFSGGQSPVWGVTFSRSYALDLQLDWQQTYLAILDDLKISHLRLGAYWDEVEPVPGQYDFTDLDWQIDQATERGVKIILAVGRRLPRWPECHDPSWVKHFTREQANQETLNLIETVIKHYQSNANIIYWQVENEPLFAWFGFCPPPDKDFLAEEVKLVKSLDHRPILITDSGELNNWQGAARNADILGTTLYRIVWNERLGFFDYFFLPPAFYRYKADITHSLKPNLQKVIITELQMEPWTMDKRMIELTLDQQQRSFNLRRFNNNVGYARRTGLREIYTWGVEYWYWLKQQGHPEIWQTAKKLWQ